MKKIFSYLLGLILFLQTKLVFAQWGDTDTNLSPVVGREILPGGGLEADNIKDSFVFSKIIPFIIDYSLRIAIIMAVFVLIFGGYQYMTAYGETEKQDTARKTITYALIGLILAITAYGIVTIITRIQLS